MRYDGGLTDIDIQAIQTMIDEHLEELTRRYGGKFTLCRSNFGELVPSDASQISWQRHAFEDFLRAELETKWEHCRP